MQSSISTTTNPTRRGNPNLHLAPRCGARTRSGCPCRSPAIRGKLRCRMHGGRSTGARTPEGLARLAAAHTTHGNHSAKWRTHDRNILSFARRSRVMLDAIRLRPWLPPELTARLNQSAPELQPPPYLTHLISRAEDRALLQAETAALAPWRVGIAQARELRRGPATPHAPVPPTVQPAAPSATTATPHAPIPPTAQPTTLSATTATPHAPVPPTVQPAAPSAAAATPHAPIPTGPSDAAAGELPRDRRNPGDATANAAAPATPHAPERRSANLNRHQRRRLEKLHRRH